MGRHSLGEPEELDITRIFDDSAARPVSSRQRLLVRLAALCTVGGLLLAGVLFPPIGALGFLSNKTGDTVTAAAAELIDKDPPLISTMVDVAGKPFARLYDQYRVLVPADQISPAMKSAIIAVEDHRFYEHNGVDLMAIARALIANEAEGRISQGGSTLTQQYVKNYLVHVAATSKQDREKALEQSTARKIRELRTAVHVEQALSKDEILARYLNTVPFGQNSYGIAAAAQTYFDVPQERMTVAQAALLAGIVNEPSGLNPYRFPERALARRNVVIDEMAAQKRIAPDVAEVEKRKPLGLAPEMSRPPNGCVGIGPAGYFCDYVLKYLSGAGVDLAALRRGGYTIKTTLDLDALAKAKEAVDAHVPPDTDQVANAMAIIKPGKDKHRVVALTANRAHGLDKSKDETTLGLPYALQNLGAGSIYKIFTAAAALEKGKSIDDVIDVPQSYVSEKFLGGGASCPMGRAGLRKYCVQNNTGSDYPEKLTIQDALAVSPNTAFVKLLEETGVPAAVDMAVRLGLRSLATTTASEDAKKRTIGKFFSDHNFGSFTLGPTPTSTMELANVGATLASEGTWCPPSPVEAVVDRAGRTLPLREEPCAQVVEPGVAKAMTVGMSKDTISGTAVTAAKTYGWDRPMAGKTGTTQEHKSAGFLGYTAELAGAVFTFDDSPTPSTLCDPGGDAPPKPCSSGTYIYGGKQPARTWFQAMNGVGERPGIMTALPRSDLPAVDDGGQDDEQKVPGVIGLTSREARAKLEKAGFTVKTTSKSSPKPKGTVIGQSHRDTAAPGTTITLQISSGR